MTPDQLRTALTRLDLSQMGAAKLLGHDGRTMRRWAAGDSGIPIPTAVLLRLLLAGKISMADIEAAKKGRTLPRAT